MDAKPAEVAAEPLKYKTWFLKVPIHCEGCRRKVKKVLRSIDGVFTTTIDPQQQKVTVTGSVGVETLIRKLVKAGKQAEIWPENLDGKGKKRSGRRDPESVENHSAENTEPNLISDKNRGTESAPNCNGESKSSSARSGGTSPEYSPGGNQTSPEDHKGGQSERVARKSSGGGSGNKKKKKAQGGGRGSNGNGLSSGPTNAHAHTGFQFQSPGLVVGREMGPAQMNLSPTRQRSYPYPETYYPTPLVYVTTHNKLYPMGRMGGPSYYVPPLSYVCAGLDHDTYQVQSAPLVSFEIFSDDNANGCSIM